MDHLVSLYQRKQVPFRDTVELKSYLFTSRELAEEFVAAIRDNRELAIRGIHARCHRPEEDYNVLPEEAAGEILRELAESGFTVGIPQRF